jgi:holo-[acyl-carrier protein] synthase
VADVIVGIGVDTIEIDRVTRACERKHFVERIFTREEQKQFDEKMRRAASDFAGKEAVVKMLGTGFSGVEANEIAVLRKESGAPYVELYGKAKEKAVELGIDAVLISITNTKELATAFAVGTSTREESL